MNEREIMFRVINAQLALEKARKECIKALSQLDDLERYIARMSDDLK